MTQRLHLHWFYLSWPCRTQPWQSDTKQLADDMDTQGCNYTQAVKTDYLWIIKMWVAGMSARDIAGQMGISVRTVHRRIRRLQTDGIVASRPYRGRLNISLPRNSSAITNSALLRPTTDHNPHYSSFFLYPQLRAEVWPENVRLWKKL